MKDNIDMQTTTSDNYPYQERIETIENDYKNKGEQVPRGFYFKDGEITRALLDHKR